MIGVNCLESSLENGWVNHYNKVAGRERERREHSMSDRGRVNIVGDSS